MDPVNWTAAATSWLWQEGELVGRQVVELALIAAVFFFAERLRPAHANQRFFKTDFGNEVSYPLFNAAITTPVTTFLIGLLIVPLLERLPWNHLLANVVTGAPFALQVFLAMVVIDIAVYVEHRFLSHGPLWDYHAIHHMTPEVSWLTFARVHPVNGFTIAATAIALHFLIGFEGKAVALAGFLSSSLSVWEHSNTNFAWPGPLRYLLVSPRFHRWHHSSDAEAVDKNFCLVFPFLDLLMGTYYCPDRNPEAYGLHRSDPEEPPIPAGFFAQLWYPFGRSLARARFPGNRDKHSVAPAPASDVSTPAG